MNKKFSLALATGALCVCAMTVPAMAADYIKGETPIFEGAAVGANDVTTRLQFPLRSIRPITGT